MRKLLMVIAALAVLAAAAWFVRSALRPGRNSFAAHQTVADAQRAVAANSNDVAALRVLALAADASRSPEALSWWRRIAELEPSRSNKLVLAATALRYEQPPFPIAAQTLKELGTAPKDAGFHLVSAQLALKQNRVADAEKHLEEAIRLEPANDSHRINLAVVRLQSRDPAVAVMAHAELEQRPASAQALRALVTHHTGRRQFTDAERFSTALLQNTNSVWSDRLDHLLVLRGAQSGRFDEFLSSLQREAATNVFTASELITRLNEIGAPSNAIAWAKSLPVPMQNQSPLPYTLASCYFSMRRWSELQEMLTPQRWDEREFARHALLTFAARRQNLDQAANTHWGEAMKAASAKPELLGALAQMSSAWGWTNETETALWRAAKDFPKERWPLESLQNSYVRGGNTRGVLDVNTLLLERQSNDSGAQNNWAALSLLLETNLPRAHQMARQVFDRDTNNFAFVSTYAWSLHVQGKSAEALKIIETIPAAQLNDPSVAGYYGALLVAAGQKEKAAQFLTRAEAAPLLPEERKMVSDARKKL